MQVVPVIFIIVRVLVGYTYFMNMRNPFDEDNKIKESKKKRNEKKKK